MIFWSSKKVWTITVMLSLKPFMLQDNLITGSLDSIDAINGAHFTDDNLSTCLQVCMTKAQLKEIGWIVLRERLLGNTENSRLCASFALLWFISHSVTFALDITNSFGSAYIQSITSDTLKRNYSTLQTASGQRQPVLASYNCEIMLHHCHVSRQQKQRSL